jgi:iron complex transport system ATP-binding protein
MLIAEDVTVGYRDKVVLKSLGVSIDPGQITVLVGPNGSGKSTLLRCLAGALRPSKGRVTVAGKDLYHLTAREAASQIAYVPQETSMPFAFTVAELVSLAESTGGRDAVREAIEVMDLTELAESPLNSLSGGEQQRAAVARGLAQQSPCLLLDEPTAHLDILYQSFLLQALRRRSRETGAVVVVVLHDLVLSVRYADRVILLNSGNIESSGAVHEVINEALLEKVYKVPVAIQRQDTRITSILPIDDLTLS